MRVFPEREELYVKLILFDIDGTLLSSDGAGRQSLESVLTDVFGSTGDPDYRYDGKTDRQIIREQMRFAGFDDAAIDARLDDILASYLAQLGTALERDPSMARLYDGVSPLLDAVEASDHVIMGLLTGNVRGGAAHKLRAVGIDIERFRVNAFGCDHEHRPELPRVAQQRAMQILGLDLPGDQLLIIGDTPADMQCGRTIGARAIGVATGRYSVDELSAHSPYAVFADLTDTERVLEVLLA